MGSTLLHRVLVPAVLATFVLGFGTVSAREGEGIGVHEEGYNVLSHVPLRPADSRMAVRAVLVEHKGETYAYDAGRGVLVESQNRINLGGIPLIGRLTAPPYSRDLFVEQNRVGEVIANGERLVIKLPRKQTLPVKAVIVNRQNAYMFQTPPRQYDGEVPAAGEKVGDAYIDPSDGSLVILVRPTVITDNRIL